MTESFSNTYQTTLNDSGGISSGDTSMIVTTATGSPAVNFRVKIDSEYLLVTAKSGTTFTVTRGIEGSTAASHADGATVTHVLTAGGLAQALSEAPGTASPKGKYHAPPSSGLIDNFSDGSITGWTLVRDEARFTWSEKYGALHAKRDTSVAGSGNRDVEAYMQSVSLSVGDYIEAAFDRTQMSNYFFAGICLSDGTTWGSGSQVMAWMHGNGGPSSTDNIRFNTLTSWNSYSSDGTSMTGGSSAYEPTYLRLKYEAANTWGIYWSRDGNSWYPIQTNYSRTLTPTYAGICLMLYDNNNTAGEGARFYYIGKNTPD